MACQYSIFIPNAYHEDMDVSGIKIFEASYSLSGSTFMYDTSALDSCNDGVCLAASMEIAFPSIAPDSWYYDDFSQVLGGGRIEEELQSVSVVDIHGNMEVLPAAQYGCDTEALAAYSGSGSGSFMTFEELTDAATVEIIITFFVFFAAWIYGLIRR